MAVVSRPPVLGISHQGSQVLLDGSQVQLLEFGSIIKLAGHRVRGRIVLMQDAEVQLVRPPILVGLTTAVQLGDGTMHHRAAACFLIAHVSISASGRVLRDYADQPNFPPVLSVTCR